MKKSLFPVLIAVLALLIPGVLFANGQKEQAAAQKVTLKFGDNLPQRDQGMGAVEQAILDKFMKDHPNVTIETESYPDQPYQQKIKLYATAGQLPDVFKYWSFSTLLKPLVDSKLVLELNRSDYAGINYLPGALDSNVYYGKLWGIPVTADMWLLYYNKALFQKAGISVPTTLQGLMDTVPKFKAMGIIPAVTDGKDAWPLTISYENIVERITGTFDTGHQALDRKGSFTEKPFVEAADILQKEAKGGLFQSDLVTSDYGASRNLFGQERAAMYFMGSWELGLANDTNFSQHFRDNIAVEPFPTMEGGKGKSTDLVAWYGGNFVASSTSKHADLDRQLLKALATEWGKLCWDKQAAIPAEIVKANPSDSDLAKGILKISSDATTTSGTDILDRATPQFKETFQQIARELVSGVLTPEQFTQQLDAAAAEAAKAQ